MTRQMKAAILSAIVFTDEVSRKMVESEAERDDPIIDVRYEIAFRRLCYESR